MLLFGCPDVGVFSAPILKSICGFNIGQQILTLGFCPPWLPFGEGAG